MRAAITGASGFVGSALTYHLLAAGDEVVSLARVDGGPDLVDRRAVFEAVGDHRVEVVYHLGAQSHVPTSWDDPITTLRVNVEGTQNVIDAAHALDVAPRVIVASSAEVYGAVEPKRLPIDEAHPLRPNNPYAASKVAADAVALQAWLGRQQDVIRARAFNHIGPGQNPKFVCAGLAKRIAQAESTGVSEIEVGNLDVRRDFCDVRDVVAAYRLLATSGRSGEAYNVCTGIDRPIRELAEGLANLSTIDCQFVTNPDLLRPVDSPVVRGNNAKLVEHTEWQPKIPLADTLADVLALAREAQQ